MKSKSALVSLAIILTISYVPILSQQKAPSPPPKPAPPPAPKPASKPFSLPQIPAPPKNSGGILGGMEPKLAETALSNVLNEQLPLKLDANAVYPTVDAIPGGPFMPHPLQLTAADLDRPLPPGDYAIPMLAFCTEYSVHRPGAGLAYRLGPLQGRAAGAIGALLWRGTLEKNKLPQQLQAVSWAIQSGLRYAQMPKTYQALIDEVIPDHRNELNGDFMQSLEDSYSGYAKSAKLPPLEQMFAKMGKPGELALSARKQRDALQRQNTTDEIREQTLFAGQEAGVYKPVRAEEGPWTERIPGVAYLRYKIVGGNLAANNVMEIRILPRGGSVAKKTRPAHLLYANYENDVPSIHAMLVPAQGTSSILATIRALIQGLIGCAMGQSAQCLIPIPSFGQQPPAQGQIANASQLKGKVTITHNGVTVPLTANTPICMGDTIVTDAGSEAVVSFIDDTQMTLAGKTKLQINDYVFDTQANHYSALYLWMEGTFKYVGGLLSKPKNSDAKIQTGYGTIGIRGTEFIATKDSASSASSISLIHGSLDIPVLGATAPMTVTGPVMISFDASGTRTSRLTQAQYDATQAQLFSGAASFAGSRAIPMPPKKGH